MIEAVPDPKVNYTFNIERLSQQLAVLKNEYQKMSQEREMLMTVASKRAKYRMGLGLVVLLGHFSFVGVGTYYVWSWDVVEPLAYFVELAGSIFLATQYFKLRGDYGNSEYHQYLTNKIF